MLVAVGRGAARTIFQRKRGYLQNTVIVGAGDVGQLIARKLLQHPEYGINLVGFVDNEPKERRADLGYLTILGTPSELREIVELLDVERVIVAFSNEPHEEMLTLIRRCATLNVQIDIVPRLFERRRPAVDVHSVEGLPLVGLPPVRLTRSSRLLKRAHRHRRRRRRCSCSPHRCSRIVAWRIKRDSPGPVFFRQTRLGTNMRQFTALKFRTMHVDADDGASRLHQGDDELAGAALGENGLYKLERADDVTQFGRWLRRTSLDELPQLLQRASRRHVARRPAAVHRLRDRVLRAAPLRALPRAGRASPGSGR